MSIEQRRLEEAKQLECPLEEMGALSQRTPVGHGARGLQRRRRRLGLLSPTIRPARAPIAGAKTAWPGSPTTSNDLCFALALWNGKDPILKERLFGLTNSEGNHGEDVKEYYFYLDSTPTHSYMKYLYKYPQAAYPVRRSGRDEPPPLPQRARIRTCSTPASSTTTATSTSSWSMPKPSGRHPDRGSRCATGAGAGRTASPADAVVSQRLVAWIAEADRRNRPSTDRWPPGTGSDRGHSIPAARRIRFCTAKAMRRCSSPRTKPTTNGCFRQTPNESPYVKDGINDCVVQGNARTR